MEVDHSEKSNGMSQENHTQELV